MTETLAYGYSSESTQQEFSNEYLQDWVLILLMVFKNLCILVIWSKVAYKALEGLMCRLLLLLLESQYAIGLQACEGISHQYSQLMDLSHSMFWTAFSPVSLTH